MADFASGLQSGLGVLLSLAQLGVERERRDYVRARSAHEQAQLQALLEQQRRAQLAAAQLQATLSSDEFRNNPRVAYVPFVEYLSAIGKGDEAPKVLDVLDKLTQRRGLELMQDMANAYLGNNAAQFLNAARQVFQLKFGIPAGVKLDAAQPGGRWTVSYYLNDPSNTVARETIDEETITRMLATLSDNPQQVVNAFVLLKKLEPEIGVLRSQAEQNYAQAYRDRQQGGLFGEQAATVAARRPSEVAESESQAALRAAEARIAAGKAAAVNAAEIYRKQIVQGLGLPTDEATYQTLPEPIRKAVDLGATLAPAAEKAGSDPVLVTQNIRAWLENPAQVRANMLQIMRANTVNGITPPDLVDHPQMQAMAETQNVVEVVRDPNDPLGRPRQVVRAVSRPVYVLRLPGVTKPLVIDGETANYVASVLGIGAVSVGTPGRQPVGQSQSSEKKQARSGVDPSELDREAAERMLSYRGLWGAP